jgi:hypothetical protein
MENERGTSAACGVRPLIDPAPATIAIRLVFRPLAAPGRASWKAHGQMRSRQSIMDPAIVLNKERAPSGPPE